MKLIYKSHFNVAHRISSWFNKYSNLHGHTLSITINISGNIGKSGMIIDIRELEDIVADYDHTTLLRECRANEELIDIFNKTDLKVVLMNYEPTLENIAKQISEEIVNLECKNVKNVTIKISDKEINQEVIYFGYTKE